MSMETRIRSRLTDALAPVHLELENESHKHNVPPGSESHWKAIIVSDAFAGKRLVQRQRLVYGALQAELSGGIHALSMKTMTVQEWEDQGGAATHQTPPCRGGTGL